MNALTRFNRFLLTEADANAVRCEFTQVLTCNSTLPKDDAVLQLLNTHNGVAGIYFWVLRQEKVEYKLYLGKTNSLAKRLLNYLSEFQAHSPNDYKLRIFGAYLAELAPAAVLDLYFATKDSGSLSEAERTAIGRYKPLLINHLPRPNINAKKQLREAFEAYYRSILRSV